MESAGMIVFEKRLGAMSDNVEWADRLIEINRKIFQLTAKMKFGLPLFRFMPTPTWKQIVELEDLFYTEANKLMDEAIEKLSSKRDESEMLFASYLINRPELDKKDVKVILLSLFSDGLSTTAPMLVYNLFNIAKHEDIQERLRAEINSVVKPWEEITPAILQKLPFLRACIKETFRLFPLTTEISRIPQRDLIIRNFKIPAGTPIDINTSILLRSPEMFNDPLKFKPTRWLRESGKHDQAHPFALLPFGFGPRMCAGRRFAEQDLQVALARIVSVFVLEHRHSAIKQIYETLMMPQGNCHFKLTPVDTFF
ncbi:unnamed protein product [Caenorhabditis auriculariae]|uniref:Uncharacterized protein n=1 Tax=Caenorhabditis auriculariae TaxID=2777116 RepID=A0A8S1HSE2_9PELO|nr:unnamed protein product [Caenorhabditis auriculariae]